MAGGIRKRGRNEKVCKAYRDRGTRERNKKLIAEREARKRTKKQAKMEARVEAGKPVPQRWLGGQQ